MDEIVDARDVLDANAITHRRFRGRVLGRFRRTGPNSWDPYRFVPEREREIEVNPGIRIQVEPVGVVFRMRSEGQVLRVEWLPTVVEQIGLGDDPRPRFMQTCVTARLNPPGRGFKAVIAKKLGV